MKVTIKQLKALAARAGVEVKRDKSEWNPWFITDPLNTDIGLFYFSAQFQGQMQQAYYILLGIIAEREGLVTR